MFSFMHYWIVHISLTYVIVGTQKSFESYITFSAAGTTYVPTYSFELPLQSVYVSSRLRCAQQCNENSFCRLFIYDKTTFYCQLYQSDLASGNIIPSTSSSQSVVGVLQYLRKFYVDYNETCNYCQVSRYLTCQNATCQCVSSITYWDGQICRSKFFYGATCNSSVQCRQDLNLSCIFGSCQPNTAVCKLGETGIIFDDIPNLDPIQGFVPTVYDGFNWTNVHYINTSISTYNASGYQFARGSGPYIAFIKPEASIEILNVTNTFTLNSCIMAAGWSDTAFITITGYYVNTALYNVTIALNTYTQNVVEFNWPGLTEVLLFPFGGGYFDIGFDNVCITF